MARTAGTIERRGDNAWRVRLYVGKGPDGRRRYVSQTVQGRKKDAERALRELLSRRDRGRGLAPSRKALGEFLREWLDVAVRRRVRRRTFAFYEAQLRYIVPALGAHRMDRLTALDLQGWVNDLASRYSTRTVRAAFGTLHTALRQGVRWGLLPADPSELVELPKKTRGRQIRSLTPEQAAAFLAACEGERLGPFFVLAVASGCRPGELAALRWKDVDLGRGVISIHRALSRLPGGDFEYGEPKTERGRRTIPLPPSASEILRRHRQRQREERLRAGGGWRDPELVFSDTGGAPLDLHNVRRRDLRRVARRAFVPHEHFRECRDCTVERWLAGKGLCIEGTRLRKQADGTTLYELRHTAATLLISGGVHVKAVSERLGHASTAFTMDTYVHSLPTAQEEAASTLEEMVFRHSRR